MLENAGENNGDEPREFYIPEFEIISLNEANEEADFSNFLDLRQVFDGAQPEVPDLEKRAVADVFASSVDDCLLNHMDDMSFSRDGDYGYTHLHLQYEFPGSEKFLIVELGRGTDNWLVDVRKYAGHDHSNMDYWGCTPKKEDYVRYKVYTGEEVIRDDKPNRNFLGRAAGMSVDEIASSHELEVAMGFNEQPINLDEAQRLADLLRDSSLKRWNPNHRE